MARRRGKAIAGAALTAALLAACDRKPAAPAAPDPVAAERQVAQAAAATPELEAAFLAAFGQKSPATRTVDREGEKVTLVYRPLKLLTLGDRLVLVAGGRVNEGCHLCVGSLAVAYLRKGATGFTAEGFWPEIADGETWGEPPMWRLREDLFPNPALEARGGGTQSGCTFEQADLIELTPEKPVVRARSILTGYDGSGEGEGRGRSIDATLKPLTPGKAFAVDYSGAVRTSVVWRRVGEAYAATGQYPPLPAC
ncbi:MAG: hypothetical protein JSR45_01800 [Proteobacteria bacterium]|nr:hypothetical protein [Pseudomonadota bacterium]